MQSVKLSALEKFIYELVCAVGMKCENAAIFTEIFMRATLRGVGHHDVYDFLHRITNFADKTINPNPVVKLVSQYAGLESYDGDNGPGELCSWSITERGMKLADEHGIGLCTIKNSNHFLASAPYVQMAAEKGYLALIFTRTNPCMGVQGGSVNVIGNAPMGFAAETNNGYQMLLDICFAYASYGSLNALARSGESIPDYWGVDSKGHPTISAGAILEGGIPYSVAGHKGFGVALLVEILTGVLSGGQIVDERNPLYEKGAGVYSQTAIVIKADGLMPIEIFKARVTEIIDRIDARAPGMHIPGQSSYQNKKVFENDGSIPLRLELINDLNQWAERLGVKKL